METPTISESHRLLEVLPRMEEHIGARGLDTTGMNIPLSVTHDTMSPFRDARGVGRVWCSLVAFPMF